MEGGNPLAEGTCWKPDPSRWGKTARAEKAWGSGELVTLGPNFSLRFRTTVQQRGELGCILPDTSGSATSPPSFTLRQRGHGTLWELCLQDGGLGPGALGPPSLHPCTGPACMVPDLGCPQCQASAVAQAALLQVVCGQRL